MRYPKKMTQVKIHDFIQEIYQTKVESDLKNVEGRAPRRTLEQHIHEVFKTKFGLKNIIFETFYSFLYSLKLYAPKDTRSMVFLKILRNEVEEEFRFAVKSVSSTLKELLKVKKIPNFSRCSL